MGKHGKLLEQENNGVSAWHAQLSACACASTRVHLQLYIFVGAKVNAIVQFHSRVGVQNKPATCCKTTNSKLKYPWPQATAHQALMQICISVHARYPPHPNDPAPYRHLTACYLLHVALALWNYCLPSVCTGIHIISLIPLTPKLS